jgi:hypothetical protein
MREHAVIVSGDADGRRTRAVAVGAAHAEQRAFVFLIPLSGGNHKTRDGCVASFVELEPIHTR